MKDSVKPFVVLIGLLVLCTQDGLDMPSYILPGPLAGQQHG